jgi:hypothetical protein
VWTSEHWANGKARSLTSGQKDPDDPTGWSLLRGNNPSLTIDGKGVMSLGGYQPRLYVSGLPAQPFVNSEVTVYYRRVSDENVAYAGGIIAVRSGYDGHTSSAPCTATTYYSRFRHDGKHDFAKELEHPNASAKGEQAIWDGSPLPKNVWIGIKYVAYTLGQQVVLEAYRDQTGGKDGGDWELIQRYVDAGGWAPAHSCSFAPDHVVTEGGGVAFVRNTSITRSDYKWMSINELPKP